ncbi:MAG: DUF4159 domain-containing protein [Spirochaetia bacterium]|nr:DUF4159 domain-containing protein [Spirochaetia bacterium]
MYYLKKFFILKHKININVKLIFYIFFILSLITNSYSMEEEWETIILGRLKYEGGGDWYSNPSSLPNLSEFFMKKTGIKMARREIIVSFSDNSFKKTPIIYFTGHGKISFSEKEKENIRWYLKNGGFIFADDNFGMDKYIREELNSLFPSSKLLELPFSHSIFQKPFMFKKGVPKIHNHYGGRPQALGLFYEERLVAFYAFNTDLGDGWEDIDVHNDGPDKHEEALKMGSNVLWHALTHGS